MITAWMKNLKSDEDKVSFERQYNASRPVLDRLKELLDEEKNSLETAEISSKMYDSPNWDYKQAHTNGFKACLKMVNKLISDKESNG